MPTALDHEHIAQLSAHYAVAVDSRDLDALVDLFVDDVNAGRHGHGRTALRQYFDVVLRSYGSSMHFIGTVQVDFTDDDRASGIVYCRADHQTLDDPPRWFAESIVYFDTYERRAGRWLIATREPRRIWQDEIGGRHKSFVREPWDDRGSDRRRLPEAWPTWKAFWDHRA